MVLLQSPGAALLCRWGAESLVLPGPQAPSWEEQGLLFWLTDPMTMAGSGSLWVLYIVGLGFTLGVVCSRIRFTLGVAHSLGSYNL